MPGMKPTMAEFEARTLKSSSGQIVTNPKQAIAIGLSEQRKTSAAPRKPRQGRPMRVGPARGGMGVPKGLGKSGDSPVPGDEDLPRMHDSSHH